MENNLKFCKECGVIIPCRSRRKVFCSYECYLKNLLDSRKIERRKQKLRENIIKICRQCGAIIDPLSRKRFFCCNECRVNFWNGNYVPKVTVSSIPKKKGVSLPSWVRGCNEWSKGTDKW